MARKAEEERRLAMIRVEEERKRVEEQIMAGNFTGLARKIITNAVDLRKRPIRFTGCAKHTSQSGVIVSYSFYKDGKLDGPFVQLFENGRLEYAGYYKAGNMSGVWIYYNRNGTESSRTTYNRYGERVAD